MTDPRAAFAKIHKLQEELYEQSYPPGGTPTPPRLPDDATRNTERPKKRTVVQVPGA